MKFLDLFAGIGGFRRGLERSGHDCVGHVEIDKYANQSYMAMYELADCPFRQDAGSNSCLMCKQEVQNNCDGTSCKGEWYAKDITKIRAGEIPKAEIWTFGFPCTDISIAGRMDGIRGSRSGLFFNVIGLLKGTNPENRPDLLIIENVKHLLSSERGGAFTTVLSELFEAGYNAEWMCVNSKNFGVQQHRERVYIVGHSRTGSGRTVFPIGGANTAPIKQIIGGQQGKRVYDISGVSVTLTASDTRGLNRNQDQNAVLSEISPCAAFIDLNPNPTTTENARCLRARQYSGIGNHRGESSGVFLCHGHPDCAMAVLTPGRKEKRQNGRRIKEPGEPSFCLTTQDQHGILLCCCEGWKDGLPIREAKKDGCTMAFPGDGINLAYPNSTKSRGRVGSQCSQTILTGGSMGVLLCCRIRRLTPRECWRLQAFEDYLFDRARAAGISDAQLYRQAGNAVTVNVVYEIGLRLAESEVADEV